MLGRILSSLLIAQAWCQIDKFHLKTYKLKTTCGGKDYFVKMGAGNEVTTDPLPAKCEEFEFTRDRRTTADYNLQSNCGDKYYLSIDHDGSVHGYHLGGHCQRFLVKKVPGTNISYNYYHLQGDCGKKFYLSVSSEGDVHSNLMGQGGSCQVFALVEVTTDPPTPVPTYPLSKFHQQTFAIESACDWDDTFYLKMGENNVVGTKDKIEKCQTFLLSRDFRTKSDYNIKGHCGNKPYVSINHAGLVVGYHLGGHCQRFKITDHDTQDSYVLVGDCGKKYSLTVDKLGRVDSSKNGLANKCNRWRFVEEKDEPLVITPAPTKEVVEEQKGCQGFEKMNQDQYKASCKRSRKSKETCQKAMCKFKNKGKKTKCTTLKKIKCKKVARGDQEMCCAFGCSFSNKKKCTGMSGF